MQNTKKKMEYEKESLMKKRNLIKEMLEKCNKSNSIIISSIERIPANLFREFRKKLKQNAEIKVVKANIAKKVLENFLDKNQIEEIKELLKKPFAMIFTNYDIFSFASFCENIKVDSFVKPGMVLEKDLVIMPTVTDLLPTAVVELSKAGFKVSVEKGRVAIKEKKIIGKGVKINNEIANALATLNVKPIKIGLDVNVGVDIKNKKLYKNVVINKEEKIEKLKKASSNALNLAINISYVCNKTAAFILQKAFTKAKILKQEIEKIEGEK